MGQDFENKEKSRGQIAYEAHNKRLNLGGLLPPWEALNSIQECWNAAAAAAIIAELQVIARWVRAGNYSKEDARDEIARAIENRTRQMEASLK